MYTYVPITGKSRYCACVHHQTLFLAVTRSSKFWSLTYVSAVKTLHFCHFCNSSLNTENAEERVTAVKIYYSLCTNGVNERRCLSEGGTSQKLGACFLKDANTWDNNFCQGCVCVCPCPQSAGSSSSVSEDKMIGHGYYVASSKC